MKPKAMAEMLNAQAGILRQAGAGGLAAELAVLADIFAKARGASVAAVLKGKPVAKSPAPALAPLVALLDGMAAMHRAVSAKSPAAKDLDAVAAALCGAGADLPEALAAFAALPTRAAKATKPASGLRREVIEAYLTKLSAAPTPEAELEVLDALAKDKTARVAELRAIAEARGHAGMGSAPKAKVLKTLRWNATFAGMGEAKRDALRAKGTL